MNELSITYHLYRQYQFSADAYCTQSWRSCIQPSGPSVCESQLFSAKPTGWWGATGGHWPLTTIGCFSNWFSSWQGHCKCRLKILLLGHRPKSKLLQSFVKRWLWSYIITLLFRKRLSSSGSHSETFCRNIFHLQFNSMLCWLLGSLWCCLGNTHFFKVQSTAVKLPHR